MSLALTWIGIVVCVTQSAAFSGLNLAVFSVSRLWLETAVQAGDTRARRALELRQDANFTLVTILLGNVAINVLLTLLADSVLAGVSAFLFSTVVITLFGEIAPQAYFARHALAATAWLSPLLRAYQIVLWPLARPVARVLDAWVGHEGILVFPESQLRDMLLHHARDPLSDVNEVEATGAINFLALDDVPAGQEGEPVSPASVIPIAFEGDRPVFPDVTPSPADPFLAQLRASGKKWVVLTDPDGEPRLVLNTDAYLREAMFSAEPASPLGRCHRPLIVRDGQLPLGQILGRLTVYPERAGDDVVDHDLILVWTPTQRRIITGADILGRLLRGISRVVLPGREGWQPS